MSAFKTKPLSKNLKQFRKKQGLSQEQLAKNADITYTTLIKLESGKNTNPTLKNLVKIADELGVSLDELVGRRKI